MNTYKRIISILTVCVLIFSVSMSTFAATPESDDLHKLEEQAYNYNRNCDRQAGIILERCDTTINGKNDIDYVELATSMSEQKDDRIEAMNMIVSVYDDVNEADKAFLETYIESYAPYTDEANLKAFCSQLYASSPSFFASYNRTNAINYATTYYSNYNSAYPDINSLGGDCANFVSQCLLAGGKSMEGDWYIYRKNNVYNKPTSSSELDYSWRLANPSPWISAKQFNNYWSNKCTTYEYSTTDYVSQHSSIYSKPIYSGDAVQLLKPVLWWYEGYHTMIIVGYSTGSDFVYAAHTSNKKDGKLLDACNNSAYSKYHIKFFSMG